MEIFKLISFSLDVFIDSQESWHFLIDDVNEILLWQISNQKPDSICSMFCKSIKNCLLLFHGVIHLAVVLIPAILELVVNKLIKSILFILILCVVLTTCIWVRFSNVAIYNHKKFKLHAQ